MKPFNITHVSGPLYVSNKVWPDRDLAVLRRLGIGAIVNLAEDHPYEVPPPMACLQAGFPDGTHPSPDQLREIYSFIDLHRPGTNVLVHCSAGVSRSVGIVVGQLMRENPGWTWEDALGLVDEKRAVWVAEETRESVLAYLAGTEQFSPSGIREEEAEALRQIQGACGTGLREVRSIGWDTRGYVSEEGHVVGLGLHNLALTAFPGAILRLAHLRDLSLTDNRLASLPAGLAQLGRLQTLNLSGNRLKALPGGIGELAQLRVLNLARNRLKELPDGIGKLSLLERLVLHENDLAGLPEAFGELSGLRELSLQHNRLVRLPAAFGGLTGLQRLAVNGNQLRSLPAGLTALAHLAALNLARNRLSDLPDGIGALTGLDNLNVSSNRLETLPDGIAALTGLRRLNIALNRFGALPPGIEAWLEELQNKGGIVIRGGPGGDQ